MDRLAQEFHRPDGPYFLSHSVGLLPRATPEYLQAQVLSPWARQGQSWHEWLPVIDRFRERLGTFLNAAPDMICPQTNVSSALTKILFSLPAPDSRNAILLSEQDFPTIGFVTAQARRLGWQLKWLPADADHSDEGVWSDALDDDVGICLVTHVYSNVGARAPVSAIARLARERGIISVIDIAQSAGALAIDLADWQADFVIGTSVKYLCGGPGAAFLWVHPDRVGQCTPLDVGWFSHEDPFEFDVKDFRYAPDARRFWGGTPSVLPYAMAASALELMNRAGSENIEAHNQALIDMLTDGLDHDRICSEARPGRRGSHILYRPADMEQARGRLAQAGIGFDERSDALRLSVHLYTNRTDIDTVLHALKEC